MYCITSTWEGLATLAQFLLHAGMLGCMIVHVWNLISSRKYVCGPAHARVQILVGGAGVRDRAAVSIVDHQAENEIRYGCVSEIKWELVNVGNCTVNLLTTFFLS